MAFSSDIHLYGVPEYASRLDLGQTRREYLNDSAVVAIEPRLTNLDCDRRLDGAWGGFSCISIILSLFLLFQRALTVEKSRVLQNYFAGI